MTKKTKAMISNLLLISLSMSTSSASEASELTKSCGHFMFESFIHSRQRSLESSSGAVLRAAIDEAVRLSRRTNPPLVLRHLSVNIDPGKYPFLDSLFATNAVATDRLPLLLGDKLIATKTLEILLGPRTKDFTPVALGLKEFLAKYDLIDSLGRISASDAKIEAALRREFPDGVILKPTEAEGSNGVGVLFETKTIAQLLASPNSPVYTEGETFVPAIGDFSNVVISGERYLLASKIAGSILDGDRKEVREYRVHIFDGQVVPEATSGRWNLWHDSVPIDTLQSIEKKTQELLELLPSGLKSSQAFSMDVMLLPDGRIQIVEINTNRGKVGHVWSAYIGSPDILGAHVRLLEQKYGWRFEGLAGQILRNDLGNLRNFLKADYRERLYEIEKGVFSKEALLQDLRMHVQKYVIPYLNLVTAQAGATSEEIQKTTRFATKYRDMIMNTSAVGDSNWNHFAAWMESLH